MNEADISAFESFFALIILFHYMVDYDVINDTKIHEEDTQFYNYILCQFLPVNRLQGTSLMLETLINITWDQSKHYINKIVRKF